MIRKFLKLFSVVALFAGIFLLASCGQTGQTEESTEDAVEETAEAEEEAAPQQPASPRAEVVEDFGGTTITLNWGSPAVKGRTIWGDLVPYGELWRAGANAASNVEFSSDVVIDGTTVAAGKYGIFIQPEEEGPWTFVLNTAWDREEHGIWATNGYDEANDVVRVSITPTWDEEVAERLSYGVSEEGLTFAWEKVRFTVPVSSAE